MNSKPIRPLQPGITQPTGVVVAKRADVIGLQRQIRSPKLPEWQHPDKVLVVPRTRYVRGWSS